MWRNPVIGMGNGPAAAVAPLPASERVPVSPHLLLQSAAGRREGGASAVEFAIAAPALLLAILGTFQTALLYQARAQLEVAAQEAVRAGTLHGASLGAIRDGLARGLTPLYTHGRDMTALAQGYAAATLAAQQADIHILNPTQEAFADFQERTRDPDGHWVTGIPSDHLGYRSVQPGQQSGLSIQDATLLKIRVVYHHPLIMPFVDHLFARFGGGAFAQAQGVQDRLLDTFPLSAEAIFRMQSPFNPSRGAAGAFEPGQTAARADIFRECRRGQQRERKPRYRSRTAGICRRGCFLRRGLVPTRNGGDESIARLHQSAGRIGIVQSFFRRFRIVQAVLPI
ncbi:TadE/TadG family type IV pilus assembly protein [Acidithiobacillus ferridurans]|uniref:TadE/TadG family type IV pilus assembly protein n=1 Tax=Acidithiobacillus ferridurans TaxID=1232575 RepID=UPI001D033126|nr:TadE/TadG family type IV pilus assembly protein [Acidithiobacillus ferridurans]